MQRQKNEIPEIHMDDQVAGQLLSNVFSACDVAPSTVPLEKIEFIGKYNRTDFNICRIIAVILMFLMLLIPVFFIPNSMKMTALPVGDCSNVTLNFTVDSLLPVFNIKAVLNGRDLPVIPVKYNHYTADASENGNLDVTITLLNGRSTTYDLTVNSILEDKDNPVITDSNLEKDVLTVYVADEGSGVDFTSIYAINSSGEKVLPLSFNESLGTVDLPYFNDTMNVFIKDKEGNELQAVVSTS